MGRYLRAQIAALRAVFPQGPGTAAVGRTSRRFDFACHNRLFNRLFLLVFGVAHFRALSGRSRNRGASAFLAQPARQHHRGNRDVHDSSSRLKRDCSPGIIIANGNSPPCCYNGVPLAIKLNLLFRTSRYTYRREKIRV